MRRYVDFDVVTRDALECSMEALELAGSEQSGQLLETYQQLPLLDDAKRVLTWTNSVRTAILSNATPATLSALVAHSGLETSFDLLLSADACRAFKPDPCVYEHASEQLGLPPGEILFVSANWWDAAGAAAYGFTVAWVDRRGGNLDRLGVSFEMVRSLDDIAFRA